MPEHIGSRNQTVITLFARMFRKTILTILCILAVTGLLAGCCFHRANPMLPKAWIPRVCTAESLEDYHGQAKLHVLVMYNEGSCTHAALRLYCKAKGALFWDPAGGFGAHHVYAGPAVRDKRFADRSKVDAVRQNDVIVIKAPSLNQYIEWRKSINTHSVEIFEFNIPDDEAEELWNILRYGTKSSHPKGAFGTNAIGGACGLAVAKFLHRFAENVAHVRTVCYPHNLAKQLYQENPDRIIIYRDKQLSYYIPCMTED